MQSEHFKFAARVDSAVLWRAKEFYFQAAFGAHEALWGKFIHYCWFSGMQNFSLSQTQSFDSTSCGFSFRLECSG